MQQLILCFNSGSSSLKFAAYDMERDERLALRGAAERLGLDGGSLWLEDGRGSRLLDRHTGRMEHEEAVTAVVAALRDQGVTRPQGVGHRLVHGGPDHGAPEKVTAHLLAALQRLVPLAPLHLPSEIRTMKAVAHDYPNVGQVACFDTAFHRTIPEVASRLPLPRSFWHEGIRRYGFHGLSLEYVVGHLGAAAKGRLVVAHLGNGASMTALKDGSPLDTSMGLTPMGGLMMGTRTGDLDPGVVLYLMNEKACDARQLDQMLNQRSGLIGVSGISSDMKTLLEMRDKEPHAAEAVEMFCYQARKFVGAYAAVLGGLDSLVFTGGIGERAAPVRLQICKGLEHLGIRIDPQHNDAHADVISTDDAACVVRVVHTDEDLMIARHTHRLIAPTTATADTA